MSVARALLAAALLAVGAGGADAQPARADTAALRRTLDALVDRYERAGRGVVGYAVRNLDTGERLDRRAAETFPTASLIKVPILVTLHDLVGKGMIALDDPITILRIDQVPGAGQLQFLHPGVTVTVGDAARLMTTISDNTATNLLLDRIAIRRVWEKMEALGLPHTKVHSKTFQRFTSVAMDSSAKYGLGVTTADEMATLFARLAAGTAVSPAADSAMLAVLADNEDRLLLQRHVDGVRAPHKTGATDSVRTECTLWELQSRVVACVLTKENKDTRWIADSEPQLLMAELGRAIVGAWPRRAPRS
ncbi:serine hydrolase [Roseisolibacter sp. H3M3-2]|uniref:serine hydrolase n=1 Tax=Roseisolibacter sp. H3M3-2 TaxID=3031323 RepID=UPI0023DC3168|nr:serine hydrolase [Roseisolibacter sp. H3M3-2]MDF1501736.1 class A beta-lactamase-related serine hydrolase [Roseisolibacter sp. H3M3-2]